MSYMVIRKREAATPPAARRTYYGAYGAHVWRGLYCARCGIRYGDYLRTFRRCV